MLTYALVSDFMQMKDVGKSGLVVVSDSVKEKMDVYLERATRFIDRFARRQFYPWMETRVYPIPYAYYDLAIRRFPTAHMTLDADLLESLVVNNGVQVVPTDGYFTLENNINPKTIVVLKYPYYWGGLTGGALRRYDQPVISITGIWGYADYQYPSDWWINTTQVVPVVNIDSTQTSFEVESANAIDTWGSTAFIKGYLIRIDDEFMEVTSVNNSTNIVTVIRGVRGTTAVGHDAGTAILRWRVLEDIKEACLQVAKTWREADLAVGGRMGVSDMSAGVEISIPADPLNTIKMYARSIIYD